MSNPGPRTFCSRERQAPMFLERFGCVGFSCLAILRIEESPKYCLIPSNSIC